MDTAPPLESVQDCVDWIAAGCKPASQFRLGVEYERLVFDRDGKLVPYAGPRSILAIFERLMARHGWEPVLEGQTIIALQRGDAGISLEPAGQLELSGAPLPTVSAIVAERDEHLAEIQGICDELGLHTAFVGINPLGTPADAPQVPKLRYQTMRARMPTVGSRGLDMMHLTCTVQVNLDFSSEVEAMEIFRLGMLATPALIALFAASPWRAGAPTGMASTRAWIWEDVEPARCDPGPWVWRPDAGFADYVGWALDVPMYFVRHQDADGAKAYHPPQRPGQTFRMMLEGGDRGRAATADDWALHLSTLFPDVRLKRVLELRACDCVPPRLLPALPALARGLCYDAAARRAALALLQDGEAVEARAALRHAAARDGLAARVGDIALAPLARQLIVLARAGLARLEVGQGPDPAGHVALDAMEAIASGEAPPVWQQVDAALRQQPSLLALRPFGS